MSEVVGIVAGIGDLAAKKNVIYPDFDAAFRQAAFSTECLVLKGLTIKDGVLQEGYALYKGYLCKLPSNTEWSTSNVYLSLKYDSDGQVNGCVFSTVVESVQQRRAEYLETAEFTNLQPTSNTKDAALTQTYTIAQSLDTSKKPIITLADGFYTPCQQHRETAAIVEQTNAIKVTIALVGLDYSTKTAFANFTLSYYVFADSVALISNGTPTADYYTYQYPRKAIYADEAANLLEGGVIDAYVTATTQPVNDKSMKVATTEFVHNQIEKDINAGSTTIIIDAPNSLNKTTFGTLTLRRKAHYVTIEYNMNLTASSAPSYRGALSDDLNFTVPSGFRPINPVVVIFQYAFVTQTGGLDVRTVPCLINKDGSTQVGADKNVTNSGYECKDD